MQQASLAMPQGQAWLLVFNHGVINLMIWSYLLTIFAIVETENGFATLKLTDLKRLCEPVIGNKFCSHKNAG